MPKIALQPISPFLLKDNISLKRKILLFESIWINESQLNTNIQMKDRELGDTSEDEILIINENLSSIEYLIDVGEISLYKGDINNTLTDAERLLIEAKMMNELSLVGPQIIQAGGITKFNNEYFSKITSDILLRAESAKLNLVGNAEFYPLLQSTDSFGMANSKARVLKLLFEKIPFPSEVVSFETIIDFKKNTDVVQKYYKLIKWINDISNTQMTESEIIDNYNDLYSDYARQYHNYKMKTSFKALEIIYGLADSLVSVINPNLAIASSLFRLWKQEMSLLEAETKFSGREIAYIFEVKKKFK